MHKVKSQKIAIQHEVHYCIMSTSECAKIHVWKKALLSIYGLQTNRGRQENIVKTIKNGSCLN